MTWTHEYEAGQEVQVHYQSAWRRGAVVSRRQRSCMVFIGKFGHINVHDPRNIRPWDSDKRKNSRSTSPENPSFDF